MKTARSTTTIAYDDLGVGEPALLLLPGWCSRRTVFCDLLPRCASRVRTLALDWRGHGESGAAPGDFGEAALVEDALAVLEAAGPRQVVPVALSHSGWVALALARRLGARVPRLVLLDWIVTEPPEAFRAALAGLQSPERWRQTVEQLFAAWLQNVDDHRVTRFVRDEMGAFGFEMWARAGREIAAAYAREGSPLRALAQLRPARPVLHAFAAASLTQHQPRGEHASGTDADAARVLEPQRSFAAEHPWFEVRPLPARTHFPMLEAPDPLAAVILDFLNP